MKAELLEKWACATCDRFHNHQSAARDCCEPKERFVCSVCNESFWDRQEGEQHLADPHGTSEMEIEERYVDALLDGSAPRLGQWAFTMNNDPDFQFLIPNDER